MKYFHTVKSWVMQYEASKMEYSRRVEVTSRKFLNNQEFRFCNHTSSRHCQSCQYRYDCHCGQIFYERATHRSAQYGSWTQVPSSSSFCFLQNTSLAQFACVAIFSLCSLLAHLVTNVTRNSSLFAHWLRRVHKICICNTLSHCQCHIRFQISMIVLPGNPFID